LPDIAPAAIPRRAVVAGGIAAIALAVGAFAVWRIDGGGGGEVMPGPRNLPIAQTVRAGDLEIDRRAPGGVLRQGRNAFAIESRRQGQAALVDAGTVRASANMTMPGMVMSGGLQVRPGGVPGRYLVTGEFGMAGAWQMTVEWDGPSGQGSVGFQGS